MCARRSLAYLHSSADADLFCLVARICDALDRMKETTALHCFFFFISNIWHVFEIEKPWVLLATTATTNREELLMLIMELSKKKQNNIRSHSGSNRLLLFCTLLCKSMTIFFVRFLSVSICLHNTVRCVSAHLNPFSVRRVQMDEFQSIQIGFIWEIGVTSVNRL